MRHGSESHRHRRQPRSARAILIASLRPHSCPALMITQVWPVDDGRTFAHSSDPRLPTVPIAAPSSKKSARRRNSWSIELASVRCFYDSSHAPSEGSPISKPFMPPFRPRGQTSRTLSRAVRSCSNARSSDASPGLAFVAELDSTASRPGASGCIGCARRGFGLSLGRRGSVTELSWSPLARRGDWKKSWRFRHESAGAWPQGLWSTWPTIWRTKPRPPLAACRPARGG